MSNADIFAGYHQAATDHEFDRLEEEGLNTPVCEWMTGDDIRREYLSAHCAQLAHRTLVARKEYDVDEAIRKFGDAMRPWIIKYVDSWSDAQRNEFMAEQDDAYLEARHLDRAEGIDA